MNKYSAVQWSPGGYNCQQGAHMHWQGGPSVQVQFPHLKISTLTTDSEECVLFLLTLLL